MFKCFHNADCLKKKKIDGVKHNNGPADNFNQTKCGKLNSNILRRDKINKNKMKDRK